MARVYKQFTAQDKALIPFNAHKQYNFTSASAASNQVTYYSGRFTSESFDVYSSGSASADIINTIKYNQIDKLYYRNYLSQIHDKLGPIEYLKQPRNLYEKVNILSIPMGLYGNKIKQGSFYLSSSGYHIIDDKFGNLLISGSDTGSYPTNIQENVFRLDPIKGFQKYDLGVHDGYATVELAPPIIYYPPVVEEGTPGYDDTPITVQDYEKHKWRRGTRIDNNIPTTYTTGKHRYRDVYRFGIHGFQSYYDNDDSYFMNKIHYRNISFNTSSIGSTSHKFPKILFRSNTGSLVSSSHSEKYNFNGDEDFAISFWIEPLPVINVGSGINYAAISPTSNDINNVFTVGTGNFNFKKKTDSKKRFILSKSKIKRIHVDTPPGNTNPDIMSKNVPAENRFPFEIYMESSSLYFSMADEDETKTVKVEMTASATSSINRPSHIFCQNSGSIMQVYFDGNLRDSTTTSFKSQTRNTADFFIGGNGDGNNLDNNGGIGISAIQNGFMVGNYISGSVSGPKYFHGDISNINIWARAYNPSTITNISESINGSPYIGNIFYQNGFATITHPKYHYALNSTGIGNLMIEATPNNNPFIIKGNNINALQFQGTHLIYEHEYQCTVQEHEFNNTTNISARKFKSKTSHELANFTTSSYFKPHVTTIGLYDDNMELLVVGKLGSPIRMSDETDTTFVVRWDT